jgi:hypothetical protein
MSITKDFIVKQGLTVQGTANSVNTGTGALIVGGGAGLGGSLSVGGTGTFGIVSGQVGLGSTSTTTSQTLRVNGGGLGVIGDSFINGQLSIGNTAYVRSTAQSISTDSGALQIQGGLGVGGGGYFGSSIWSAGYQVVTTGTLGTQAVTFISAGTDTVVNTATGSILIWSTATLASVSGRAGGGYAAGLTPNAITVQNSTSATSTLTGALIVQYGGVGIGQNLYVGGTANVTGIVNANASLNVATTASFNSTLDATSITTGSVLIAGGLAVAKTIYSFNHVITNASASVSSTASNALVVSAGGLGVQGSALIGGNVVLQAPTNSLNTNSSQALLVSGGVGVGGNLVAGIIKTADTQPSTVGGAGSVQVAGGAYIANNLVVAGTQASTGTTTSNALYVAGGVGIAGSLYVGGVVTFSSPVTFNGTATYVLSTNTFYTDNIIEVHVPPGGVSSQWTLDDGKDIGLRFHYYNRALSTDSNAALVLADDSQLLEWYGTGAESITSGTFINSAYGGFKLGYIQLMTGTSAISTTSGALQVQGGIGVNANSYFAGRQGTASSSTVNQQAIVIASNGLGVTGDSYFANNLGIGGGYGVSVANNITAGASIIVAGTGATGSTSSVGSQALQVTANGLGVTGASYINGALSVSGLTQISNTTNSTGFGNGALTVVGGLGVAKDLYVNTAFNIYGNLTGLATTATNLAGGATGSIAYQTTSGSTAFIGIGLNNYILQSNGTTATWQNPNSLVIGTAANAANVAVTGTNANITYYPTIAQFVYPAGVYEPLYSTSSFSINGNTGVMTLSGVVDSTTSTNGTIITSGGIGVAKSMVVGGNSTHYGPVVVLNNQAATTSSSASSAAALQVAGGASVQGSVYAGNIFDNNNRVITSISPSSTLGISISNLSSGGPTASFTINNTGVTATIGTTYLGVSSSTGAVTFTNLGVQTLTAGTDTAVSASTGTVTVWSTSTLQSVTDRGAATNRSISITSVTNSTSTTTGALTVQGGVGVGANITLGGTLNRTGNVNAAGWLASGVGLVSSTATFTDTSLTGAQPLVAVNALGVPTIAASNSPTYSDAATLYIAGAPTTGTNAIITNPWSLLIPSGNVKFGSTATSISTSSGALVVGGGLAVGGNLRTGDNITAGTAATGIPVVGFVSNNATVASYTSSALGAATTSTAQLLDVWSTGTYRSARYSVQLVDTGFTPNRVHFTEIVLLHDGAANVYKSEYGVVTNIGELGTFDATVTGNGIQLTFQPTWPTITPPSALVVKALRTTISL